jgi:hypothetical protein
MPGYSGTPLPKKLSLKPGFRVRLVNLPYEVHAELAADLATCSQPGRGQLDFAVLFTKSQKELARGFEPLAKLLAPTGMLWISWPKKSSGTDTDLSENFVREVGLTAGLVDVKVCAITESWSGLKFVRRIKDRKRSP